MVEQNILQFYQANETAENEENETLNYIFEIGETIKNYTIERLITQKKFVEIYLAKAKTTAQLVVIKVMRYDKIFPPKLAAEIAYFKQEFDMMRQLSHPNICAFVDYYSDEYLTFGVMEYIEGEDTRKHLKKQENTLSQRLHLFKQMVKSVAHLHEKGLTHGDLHASNFMISEQNEVKLIDFGFTHHVEALEHELEIEGGTMAYLPPECVNPNSFEITSQRVNFRGEVYQLGVIAYILLYEVRPFRGLTWLQLCENIKTKKPSFQPSTPKGEIIPDFILNLVQTAMNRQPDLRFANAVEILNNWA
ncbi:MAG: serine/threonine protein kinase [Saprospiraceae bacterium]|nr:serine/threonine protein kinase [Saprospiraceae bacterium]